MLLDKPRVLIIGSTGFLGSILASDLNATVEVVNRSFLDLSKPLTLEFREYMKNKKFNYVIISAAIADVEKCYQNQVLSQQVNVDGGKAVLDMAKETKAVPVFFSSDYVFSGKEAPYNEVDLRRPLTVYGAQKLAVENYLESHFDDFLIFRTSKLMSKTSHTKNILLPILRDLFLGKACMCFEDQLLNPVFVEDIAEVLNKSFALNLRGIFHLGTRRVFSRFELGRFLASSLGYDQCLVQPIRMEDIKFSEKRPTNNTLNCRKIEKALNFTFNEVENALSDLRMIRSLLITS